VPTPNGARKRFTQGFKLDALRLLEVDERGLDEMDRRLLQALIGKYQGGPVGLSTLAVVVGAKFYTEGAGAAMGAGAGMGSRM